jgi:hypothetical protein
MEKFPVSFDNFYRIVEENIDNPALNVNLEEYRKTFPVVKINREKFLSELYKSFNSKENLFYNSIKNIIERPEFEVIPLEDFFEKINIIFGKMVKKIRNILEEDKEAIIHLLYDEFGKSNFWLSLLFAKYVKDNNLYEEFKENLHFIDSEKNLEVCADKNNHVIFLDDCSYSGTQLRSNISGFNEEYIKGTYLFIPYISSYALKILSENFLKLEIYYEKELLSFLKNRELLKAILENTLLIFDEKCDYITNTLNYLSIVGFKTIPSMIELKNADGMSAFQALFNYIRTPDRFKEKLILYKIKKDKIDEIIEGINKTYESNIDENFFSKIYDFKMNKHKDLFDNYFEKIQENVTFEQNDIYLNKTIGLLDNCYQEEYLKIIRNNTEIKIAIDYLNEVLCFSAFYRKIPFRISKELKKIFEKSVTSYTNNIIFTKGEKHPIFPKNIIFEKEFANRVWDDCKQEILKTIRNTKSPRVPGMEGLGGYNWEDMDAETFRELLIKQIEKL